MGSRDKIKEAYKKLDTVLDGVDDGNATIEQQTKALQAIEEMSFYATRVLVMDLESK